MCYLLIINFDKIIVLGFFGIIGGMLRFLKVYRVKIFFIILD